MDTCLWHHYLCSWMVHVPSKFKCLCLLVRERPRGGVLGFMLWSISIIFHCVNWTRSHTGMSNNATYYYHFLCLNFCPSNILIFAHSFVYRLSQKLRHTKKNQLDLIQFAQVNVVHVHYISYIIILLVHVLLWHALWRQSGNSLCSRSCMTRFSVDHQYAIGRQ